MRGSLVAASFHVLASTAAAAADTSAGQPLAAGAAASDRCDKDCFRRRLNSWAAAWEGRPDCEASAAAEAEATCRNTGQAKEEDILRARAAVLAELQALVQDDATASFDEVKRFASWAADTPNSMRGGVFAVSAALLEAVALRAECLQELQELTELQTRCTQRWYKIAIQKLLANDDANGAERMWRRSRGIRIAAKGKGKTAAGRDAVSQTMLPDEEAAMPWPSALQTPTIWVRGLGSEPFWDCHTWPFVRRLEAQASSILAEALRAAPRLTAAYPYLFTKGSWQNFFLFRGKAWNAEVCTAMPHTCHLLVPEIPTKPSLPYIVPNNEEIVLFRSEPGAHVGPHSGAVNNQINIHLTLTGGDGVFLKIGEEKRELRNGRALCFQDSWVHSLEHTCHEKEKGCPERISLVTRVFHPDMAPEHYEGSDRTDAEDLSSWSSSKNFETELGRLREQFRILAHMHQNLSSQVAELEKPCTAPEPTTGELEKAKALFDFLSTPYGPLSAAAQEQVAADTETPLDAIVVLSNWYDRSAKVRRVLELAERHRKAPIVVVGGRGRLSSRRAAELDGEAHATLARLLVLLEIPGDLSTVSADRITAISCNECETAELRRKCGCVGNTGFNTDRFLDWAAVNLPPLKEQ
eukprot:TRINITY_DN25944_c0_g1_i1.p1 TRINITY_DN25944_c0_g1~~TRINITY_DN25944_c0_g1_i1.p1  ORF type:complete len:677 (-),score=139.61 TRINITY_DN25944_c0_g1_i1:340-2253(-)